MKKLVVVLMAMGLFGAMPVLAAEHGDMKMDTQSGMMNTDEGLRQCVLQAESIQDKITRIQGEIKKGSKKYNANELKVLEEKLRGANELLNEAEKAYSR